MAERSKVAPAEYLAWEREQPTKHEYLRGEVFAMSGGSYRHNALSANMITALRAAFAGRSCTTFTSDQRVGVDGDRYVYPDVTIVCGAIASETGTRDVLVNPNVIVEVLSKSTEEYDRGLTWEGYQRISSLTDYLLVSQVDARVEPFRRDPDGGWHYRAFVSGERLRLTAGVELAVDTIYAGVLELPLADDQPA